LTLWLPVGLENHLELRHRLQVFEVKHISINDKRDLRAFNSRSTSVAP
jgi:hypothetical protein